MRPAVASQALVVGRWLLGFHELPVLGFTLEGANQRLLVALGLALHCARPGLPLKRHLSRWFDDLLRVHGSQNAFRRRLFRQRCFFLSHAAIAHGLCIWAGLCCCGLRGRFLRIFRDGFLVLEGLCLNVARMGGSHAVQTVRCSKRGLCRWRGSQLG